MYRKSIWAQPVEISSPITHLRKLTVVRHSNLTPAYPVQTICLYLHRQTEDLLPGVLVKSDLDADMLSVTAGGMIILTRWCTTDAAPPVLRVEKQGMKASQSIYKINVPLLVMHGSGDQITSVKQTRNFVRNAGNRTIYKEWPGYYHELHNDTGAGEVFSFLLDWLERQIPALPAGKS
jgi:alpha-beta hydrolase superfamily lysophospholipase